MLVKLRIDRIIECDQEDYEMFTEMVEDGATTELEENFDDVEPSISVYIINDTNDKASDI